MRAVLAALAVLLAAGVASAATTRKVPSQYATIQAAVDDADPGDTILVSKRADGKPWDERVICDKSLKFVGKKVIWDGHDAEGGYGQCLTVDNAATLTGVVVQGFVFRNGDTPLYVHGDGTLVQSCTFRGSYETALALAGENVRVTKCTFRGNYRAAQVSGGGATLDRNVLSSHANGGFVVYGSGATMTRNRCADSGEDNALYAGGGTTVSGNIVTGGIRGIQVTGDSSLVEGNRISRVAGESTGIACYGRGNTVRGNSVVQADGDAILVDGLEGSAEAQNDVEGNLVRSARGYGIRVHNWATLVKGNTVASTGASGIHVTRDVATSGMVVLSNDVSGAGDTGIYAQGGGMFVVGNTVRGTSNAGIQIAGGGAVDGCTVSENRVSETFGNGIYVYASGTSYSVEDNEVSDVLGWNDAINVYAYDGPAGGVRRNTVTASSGGGIHVNAYGSGNGTAVVDNVISGGGTYFDAGIYFAGHDATILANRVDDMVNTGIEVTGTGSNTIDGNSISRCDGVGLVVFGDGNTVTGNTGRSGDGEGFSNIGTATVFTGNSFLGFRLDVTSNGSFATAAIDTVNEFATGGASTGAQYWIP